MDLGSILFVFDKVIKYLPFVTNLVKEVEKTKETGEIKKSMAMGTAKSLVHIAATEATGGAKDSWSELEEPFSFLIDSVCSAVFGSKESIKFKDDPNSDLTG